MMGELLELLRPLGLAPPATALSPPFALKDPNFSLCMLELPLRLGRSPARVDELKLLLAGIGPVGEPDTTAPPPLAPPAAFSSAM